MSTIVSDIITKRARPTLNDTSTETNGQKWSDAFLLLMLIDGQNIIVDQRSEESMDTDGITERTYAEPTGMGDTVYVGDKWREALMHYICARAFEQPGDERYNLEAAGYHDNKFWELIKQL